MKKIVYLVFEQTSDQYGKNEFRKVFAEKADAEKYQDTLRRRSYIQEAEME